MPSIRRITDEERINEFAVNRRDSNNCHLSPRSNL